MFNTNDVNFNHNHIESTKGVISGSTERLRDAQGQDISNSLAHFNENVVSSQVEIKDYQHDGFLVR